MAEAFEFGFLHFDRGDDATGEIEETIRKNGDFHTLSIACFRNLKFFSRVFAGSVGMSRNIS